MPTSLRTLVLVLLAAFSLGACGGDDASSLSVDQLLKETFSSDQKVEKGKLDVKLGLDVKGGQANGPVNIRFAGPFETQGEGKLPKFKFDATFEGAGQSIGAGATSTGDKGFVTFQGANYVVSEQVFSQFKKGFEDAQKTASKDNKNPSLATLGIDPRKWLQNPKNAGEAKVGDDEVIKITGGVDVDKLLDDVNQALDKSRALGLQGGAQLPSKLTDKQRRQVTEAIKSPTVEIYTGKDDRILRRMLIKLTVDPGEQTKELDSAGVTFDMSILDVNEDQNIPTPENAKPLDQLLQSFGGGLGALGLGGAGGGAATPDPGAAGAGGSGGSNSGAAEALEKYSECIKKAGNDTAEAQKCAELLQP
jgi:hypothetical protein